MAKTYLPAGGGLTFKSVLRFVGPSPLDGRGVVNTLTDISLAKDNHYDKYSNKTTIITNFGIHNINNFDNIAKYALQFPSRTAK